MNKNNIPPNIEPKSYNKQEVYYGQYLNENMNQHNYYQNMDINPLNYMHNKYLNQDMYYPNQNYYINNNNQMYPNLNLNPNLNPNPQYFNQNPNIRIPHHPINPELYYNSSPSFSPNSNSNSNSNFNSNFNSSPKFSNNNFDNDLTSDNFLSLRNPEKVLEESRILGIINKNNTKEKQETNNELILESNKLEKIKIEATVDDVIDEDYEEKNNYNKKSSNRSSTSPTKLVQNNRWREDKNDDKNDNKQKNTISSPPGLDIKLDMKIETKIVESEFVQSIIELDESFELEPNGKTSPIKEDINSQSNFAGDGSPSKAKINYEIKNWASLPVKLDKLIEEFKKNRNRWENNINRIGNMKNIICSLSKYCRYDMLEYLRIKCPIYTEKLNFYEDFYPFHELVWMNFTLQENIRKKTNHIEKNVKNIKLTFEELVKFGFDIFIFSHRETNNKEDLVESENYLTCLMHQHNKLSLESKKELYTYFVKEWDNLHLVNTLVRKMLNSTTKEMDKYIPDLIYFIKKYNKDALEKIIITLCDEVNLENNINSNSSRLYNIIFGLCSEIKDNIYTESYPIVNYSNFRKDLVNRIVKSYSQWIFDKIYANYLTVSINSKNMYDQDVYINNLVSRYYKTVMKILGYFYQNNISKENILTNLKGLIGSKIEGIDISLLCFLSSSNINPSKTSGIEHTFVSSYLIEYYTKSSLKIKIYIRKTLEDLAGSSLTTEQIDNIILK